MAGAGSFLGATLSRVPEPNVRALPASNHVVHDCSSTLNCSYAFQPCGPWYTRGGSYPDRLGLRSAVGPKARTMYSRQFWA